MGNIKGNIMGHIMGLLIAFLLYYSIMFPIMFPLMFPIMFRCSSLAARVTFSHNNFHNVSAPSLPARPPGGPPARPSSRAPLLPVMLDDNNPSLRFTFPIANVLMEANGASKCSQHFDFYFFEVLPGDLYHGRDEYSCLIVAL